MMLSVYPTAAPTIIALVGGSTAVHLAARERRGRQALARHGPTGKAAR